MQQDYQNLPPKYLDKERGKRIGVLTSHRLPHINVFFSICTMFVATISLICAQPAYANGWSYWVNDAQLDWANSKLSSAESKLKQSVGIAESDANSWQLQWSHYYLGLLYGSLRNYPLAEKEFNTVLQKSKNGGISVPARKSLAQVYYLTGNKQGVLRLKPQIDADRLASSAQHKYMESVEGQVKEHWKPRKLTTCASTVVSFYLDQEGNPHEAHISSSSGVSLADQIAVETIDSMPALGKVPVAGEEPCIDFAFDYNYEKKAEGPKTGCRSAFGQFVLSSSSSANNLAQQKQKLASKEQTLKRELSALDTNPETMSNAVIQKREQLMDCLLDEKKLAEAETIASGLCAYFEKNKIDDLLAVHALMKSGEIAVEESKVARAKDFFEHAMNMSKKIKPEGSPEEKESMLAFAKCLYRLGDTNAANVLYEKLKAYKSGAQK